MPHDYIPRGKRGAMFRDMTALEALYGEAEGEEWTKVGPYDYNFTRCGRPSRDTNECVCVCARAPPRL